MKRSLGNDDIPDAKRLKLSSNEENEKKVNTDDDTKEKELSNDGSSNLESNRLQVTICGGGNGAHAFVVTVGAVLNPHQFKIHWLSLYGDESKNINNKLSQNNGYLTAHFKQENMKIQVKPDLVTNDPSKAIPNSDIIILCVPAFAHGMYLDAIKKFHEISNNSNCNSNSNSTKHNNKNEKSKDHNSNSNDNSNDNSNGMEEEEEEDIDIQLGGSNNTSSKKKELIIAAFPSQSGLEFLFLKTFFRDNNDNNNNENANDNNDDSKIILFSCLTLPWACRIAEYGELVEILALKKEIDVCCWFKDNHTYNNKSSNNIEYQLYLDKLQSLFFEKYPKILCNPNNHILSSTLGSMNPIGHGAIMYDKWKDYIIGTHFNKKPLFYHGITKETSNIMSDLSSEVVLIGKILEKYNNKYKISNKNIIVPHVFPWFKEAYGDVCKNSETLYDLIMTNPGYANLTHPMKLLKYHETVSESKSGGEFELQWIPDWNYRYLTEDIPFGLLVIKAIACMINDDKNVENNDKIETPVMDKICLWAQKVMNKDYFIVKNENNDGDNNNNENKDGFNKVSVNFESKDIQNSRIPQILGFSTIEDILRM